MKKLLNHLLGLFFVYMSLSHAFAQDRYLRSIVKDSKNIPIIGASVLIKGTQKGTVTDENGAFALSLKNEESITLVITAVGYLKQEMIISKNGIANEFIVLEEEIKTLDELIVTGVFDSRKRIESSVAITTIDSKGLDRIVPNSAIELLRQVPGVYTNTSRGEIFNNVIVRGMVLGNYVSIQEDGLPVVPAPIQIAPDGFLRADVNIGRLEAVRGGTASILGANAPGGIFNYISKTGTSTFTGEARTRFGLEGNVKNPYYRFEAGFGGPLSKDKTWTYYIGGHYRHANGAKYPGYPLSRGGQLKGNIVKKYKNGSIQLNLKYLHDRTAQFELTPTVDFNNPHPPGDFTNTTSTLNPLVTLNYPASILGGLRSVTYNSKNLNLYKEISPTLSWEHRFGNGWKLQNTFRYSQKSILTNSSLIVFPYSLDKFFFYAVNGWLGKFGTYNFYNTKTKQSYGSVMQALDFSNPNFPFKFTANLNLPGAAVQPNSVFYSPIGIEENASKDFVNQLAVKKHFSRMDFTAGLFHSTTQVEQYIFPPAGQAFGTIEDRPQFIGIDYIPSDTPNPATYRLTDSNGISQYGVGGVFFDKATVRQTAFFAGHNWDISDRLNMDWGLRYEYFYIKGSNVRTDTKETTEGGVDGNSITLYDNDIYKLGNYVNYESPLNTYAFSVGFNYKVHNNLAFYARYSNGSKTPDYNNFYASGATFTIEPQRTVQIELGIKLTKGRNNLFITPFYSALDKIPQQDRGQNIGEPVTFYPTPKLYNKTHAIGVEVEGNYTLNNHWSIRASGMVQQFTADKYQFYDTRQNGPGDDTLIDRSKKKISSAAPPTIFTFTPTYTHHKLYTNINWYFMGKRAANTSETFYLPAFSQIDLNIGYAISPKIQLQASINNLVNTFGIMDWSAPTTSGLPFDTFNKEGFTPDKRAANPNVVYYSSIIQSRSVWLSCALKF